MNDDYLRNMIIMTVMWSASSFSNYLLNFMNKYLEGTIFQNNYYEGLAGIVAACVGAQIYGRFGKRYAFNFAFGLALSGGIIIYLLESHRISIPESILMSFPGGTKS